MVQTPLEYIQSEEGAYKDTKTINSKNAIVA